MAENLMKHDVYQEDVEEYVLLDLDAVSGLVDIPAKAPYVLSISSRSWDFQLSIGEYEEITGTCFVFSEDEAAPVDHEETGPSEANLFSRQCIIEPPRKQVKPIARLHKILNTGNNMDEFVTFKPRGEIPGFFSTCSFLHSRG
ncbi:hypothetical protein SLEP1_g46286 [Rubroshorea leprosula]|uniref:Transcription factor TFIIIC triple barrel domain-containing protein n=1 Tax=Rubroshorea leprosula TaxID=152421 RepID=A0AAV5LMM6_9ROSI|nr:hypothetical protein SLEP1_g46286 [Rubroshorea leprosula]